ncbi:TPA_asm: P overlapped [Rubus alphacytorhabdovirus 1]|nr:TPA_asm: P overlapped [Rubus alphacytorhabdovirus 1]
MNFFLSVILFLTNLYFKVLISLAKSLWENPENMEIWLAVFPHLITCLAAGWMTTSIIWKIITFLSLLWKLSTMIIRMLMRVSLIWSHLKNLWL